MTKKRELQGEITSALAFFTLMLIRQPYLSSNFYKLHLLKFVPDYITLLSIKLEGGPGSGLPNK